MALHPQAKLVVDAMAGAVAAGKRRNVEELTPSATDHLAPGTDGDIPVRLYRPAGSDAAAPLPVLVYYHGGGWVIGNLESHDSLCRKIANAGGFVVAAVDYRLGPESRFPAAVEDAFAAVQWLAAGPGGLAIDNTRIAVSGDSAGGNLSAVVTLLARDQGPALAHQALIYPATHFRRNTASHTEFAEGYLLTAAAQDWFRDHYLNDAADRDDWRASPLLAEDHSGLPPALVITAECDPLRDEGKAYADKLAAAAGDGG